MAKSRAQKEAELKALMEALEDPEIVIFTAQKGITVKDTQEIRNAQKEKGSTVITIKKTLLGKALAEKGLEAEMIKDADGLISVVINHEDPINPSKLIMKYKGEFEGLEILGGIYEGKVVDANTIKELSVLPTFEEAIAKFMFAMQAVGNKFAATLDALREKLENEGEASNNEASENTDKDEEKNDTEKKEEEEKTEEKSNDASEEKEAEKAE